MSLQVYRILGLLCIPIGIGWEFSPSLGLIAFGVMCALIGFAGVRR